MFVGKLKPFQEPGVERAYERGNFLLALRMGLGKSPIIIAVVEKLIENGEAKSGLIVCQSNLKYQWERQISKFTDGAPVLVINGTPAQRKKLYEEAIQGGYDYVILNYEQVRDDFRFVSKIPRDFVVADEITYVKGFKAARTKSFKKLDAPFRFGLSGKPIENRPEDLFSILEWIDPSVLGRFDIFDKTFIVRNKYGGVKYYKNLPTLHRRLAPIIYIKTENDPDVAPYLPKAVFEEIPVKLDFVAVKLYKKISRELRDDIAYFMQKYRRGFDVAAHYGKSSPSKIALAQGRIMSKLMCLRMLCDHPALLTRSADLFERTEKLRETYGVRGGSQYAHQLSKYGWLDGLSKAPKLDSTVDLIKEILEDDPKNKIVVFSFFKPMLGMLQEATSTLATSVVYTGDLNARQKDASVQAFMHQKKVRIFFSSDAGGYGLDLPVGNFCIDFDLPWSAAVLDQRNSRIRRLSSKFDKITVVNQIVRGSIEERQLDMLNTKNLIASAWLDGKGVDKKGTLKLSLQTLSEFLDTTGV